MKFIPVFLILLIIVACKDQPAHPANEPETIGVDSSKLAADTGGTFLPIQDLIREDIRHVDSFAGGILRKSTINGKMDSAFIKPKAFHQAAAAFLIPELEADTFRHSFTESSFMDESVDQIQFIYTPKNAAQSLRNVVAYITRTPNGDQISRFYYERSYRAGDTAIDQKFTWKTHQYCYIITVKQPATGPAITLVDKYIWDPEQFGQ
ncbi:hypothetical protein [Paraflavitalea pollutisoli]|uniref:hypothetical protein n=1 Tax=Paraflavitalea pollutisoli TaxID=3034143 RepID=UPI0023EB8824|nr:hypothetical protein [Paraflavitalea sp. H1-2-19X]